ncbi:MAG: hypothetical protein ACRDY0_05510 [Acidimicrobiales bacterium]
MDQGSYHWGPGAGDDDHRFVPQPPYGVAAGPLVDDGDVLDAYAAARPGDQAGHSARFHVEGDTLLADGDVAVGLRLEPDVVLVRIDLPDDLGEARTGLEGSLAGEAMTCLDSDSVLAGPVALQVLGLRLSKWDLWGKDVDQAFAALRRGAVGDQGLPVW